MAAYAKRKKKSIVMDNFNNLTVSDVYCYICRGVLIEPVTSPCEHVFCLSCFNQSMLETSYSCPLCRKRISNWVRTAKKENKLVNKPLWEAIQNQFHQQVTLKLNGDEDGLDEYMKNDCVIPKNIAKPGETASEFKKLLNEIEGETLKKKIEEERATEEYILQLKQKELKEFNDSMQAVILKDEEIARRMQAEEDLQHKVTPSTSQRIVQTRKSSSKLKKVEIGPLDKFFKTEEVKNGLHSTSEERSASIDSADSICSELHHFKPIKAAPKTPPKQWPDGKFLSLSVRRYTLDDGTGIESKLSSSNENIPSPYSAFKSGFHVEKETEPQNTVPDDSSSPKKRLRFSPIDTELNTCGVLKEINIDENSDSNSDLLRNKIKDEQMKIEQMLLQEKSDRELALKLSKEWEKEGSTYELRRKPRKVQPLCGQKQQTLMEAMVSKSRK